MTYQLTTAQIEAGIRHQVRMSGMSSRESASTVEGITPEIRQRIPDRVTAACAAGERPPGFGLVGPVGSGKTGTIAALLLQAIRARVAAGHVQVDIEPLLEGGYKRPPVLLRWCSWPETVNRFRVLAGETGGMGAVEDEAHTLSRAWALVIDDLGAERIRTGYTDDWATSLLDLVIDRRYANRDPIWYTSSLTPPELVAKYGRRMIERLAMENPAISVGAVESRRALAWKP